MKTRSSSKKDATQPGSEQDEDGADDNTAKRKDEQRDDSHQKDSKPSKPKGKKRAREEPLKEPVHKRKKTTTVKEPSERKKTQKSKPTKEGDASNTPSEWIPPSVKRTKKEDALCDPNIPFSSKDLDSLPKRNGPTERCLRKGPHGSPTKDELGYELDYKAIAKASHRPRARAMSDKYMEMLDREAENDRRREEIMGVSEAESHKLPGIAESAMTNRVAIDLGIPYHTVGMGEFEEWHRRGFRAELKDWKNLPKEQVDRLLKIQSGCAFRKGRRE